MKKLCLAVFITFSFFFQSEAVAKDPTSITIFKESGKPPQVTADSVDLIGADHIYQLLGEDFIVIRQYGGGGSTEIRLTPKEVPFEFRVGKPPRIAPLCQCPEEYVAQLTERFSGLELDSILVPQSENQSILSGNTPNSTEYIYQKPTIFEYQYPEYAIPKNTTPEMWSTENTPSFGTGGLDSN